MGPIKTQIWVWIALSSCSVGFKTSPTRWFLPLCSRVVRTPSYSSKDLRKYKRIQYSSRNNSGSKDKTTSSIKRKEKRNTSSAGLNPC